MQRDIFKIQDEVFSDGTNSNCKYNVKPWKVKDITEEQKFRARNPKTGKKIKANPGAAEVWLMEKQNGAPWREKAERIRQIEDEKAKKEMEAKKISQLAKQICQGLKTVFNAHFESSELIPLLRHAMKESHKPRPDPNSSALLKAVQRYDLKQVSRLLQAFDKEEKETPSLSITTLPPVRPRP